MPAIALGQFSQVFDKAKEEVKQSAEHLDKVIGITIGAIAVKSSLMLLTYLKNRFEDEEQDE